MSISNRRGMTLIEILIVLAIIGSLLAILGPRVTSQLDKSKLGETKIIMGQIANALNMYYTDCGRYPDAMEGLIQADSACSNWGPEPYLKKAPKDAWGTEFQYFIEGNQYIIKSLGSDRREGGDGYAKDISSEDIQ